MSLESAPPRSSGPAEAAPRSSLALVIHFHQPVGNLDAVVARATERCYLPFIETLERSEDVKLTLHYSGCLLEWLETNASIVTDKLNGLVAAGRVELMTGGLYEPVLAALPHADRVGQIEALSARLRADYGTEPTGVWLAERVWEPEVVGALLDAGATYTVLDDTMFHSVGIADAAMTGAFVTEQDGRPLLVYAGDRRLRYLIPYKRVERVLDYVRNPGARRLFVYADDGEKFGEWPDTYERVYANGWLESFFKELGNARSDVRLVTLGEHAAGATPVGRVYLPSASYDEMMKWALPNDARLTLGRVRRKLEQDDTEGALAFTRGAPWRAFLAKYPEVNHLQKRMLLASDAVHRAGDLAEALRELYRAQCNCAYWHGAFGGVYLGFMRSALWHHLLRAEALSRSEGMVANAIDFDADGREEILLSGPATATLIAPHRGGRLLELDDYRLGANVLAVMARHKEAYHVEEENPVAGDDLAEGDEMPALQASAGVDHAALRFDEDAYGALIDLVDGRRVDVVYDFSLEAEVAALTGRAAGLAFEKRIALTGDGLACRQRVTNTTKKHFNGIFGSESFVLPLSLGREVEADHVDIEASRWRVAQPEGEVAVEVQLSEPALITARAIETASATLEGLQTMRQGTQVTAEWTLDLAEGRSFEVTQTWHLIAAAVPGKQDLGVSA